MVCVFWQVYNGVTRFDKGIEEIDFVVYTDASFKGMGACVNNWFMNMRLKVTDQI
jgi:hypothetical protein